MKVLNEGLMEQMLESDNLRAAWRAVKANHGAPGIDSISVDAFIEHISPHWKKVRTKILAGRYKPAPVKRVHIPKGNGSTRALGIPAVLDRVLQQAMLNVLQPHFEPLFSAHSFGFRPGRSAHDALKVAQAFIAEGLDWVVDIDLQSFLDHASYYTPVNEKWLNSVGWSSNTFIRNPLRFPR